MAKMLWHLLKHLYPKRMALKISNILKCVTIVIEATIAWVIIMQIVEVAVVKHCMDIGSY